MQAESTMVKSKKRKIDVGTSVQVEEDFPIPPILGPYESLASELKNVKEIVTKLPQGGRRVEISSLHGCGGVKGLLKVLKINEPLPTSRPNKDRDEPTVWNDDEGVKDSEATDSEYN
ncbi:hypothetical protein KY290_036883 [Solanum tuberosum]|uniref:Uncharacterized protein n=1 Tax=Solanum tuberosum TaxID=4113 RepID=A0ABQ7TUS1_SOLTU|nr:hypothetical protein KY290_036883 [Solanum tuberosum]